MTNRPASRQGRRGGRAQTQQRLRRCSPHSAPPPWPR